MINDRKILISVGNHRRSVNWQPQTLLLSELYERLRMPARGTETMQDYLNMKKSEQDDLKDVGGYVAGSLTGARRKAGAVAGREVLTLDLDTIPPGGTADVMQRVEGLGCGYCIYSTRKHSPASPRLRVLLPLDRTATADEYEPLARKMAETIGMEFADPTTFEVTRLMYWPSICADSEYIFTYADKPMLAVDELLALYDDWRDVASWPRHAGETPHAKLAMKQGDPLTKAGVVGAFCRVYDVPQAMDVFLPGIYESVDTMPGRYTYLGGSTTGGAVLYDNARFLYSHHATDPCSGKLVNAFDLVRLHKFEGLDDSAPANAFGNQLPSYKQMIQLALVDKEVTLLMAKEDFSETDAPAANNELDWIQLLSRTQNGYEKTYQNVGVLLEHHPKLKGRIKFNAFAEWIIGIAPLPWGNRENEEGPFIWSDADDSGLKIFIEKAFSFRAPDVINVALSAHFAAHSFNPVTDYLRGLMWDGVPRLDTLFADYLGAARDDYTKTVTRKSFVAAVARAFEPGTKYDQMLVLISEKEGIGKSTLLFKMAHGWFNDNMITFEGNKASEALQGAWLIEVAEMHALAKTDVNRIKQFLSQREDIYRRAYGRRTEWHPRRCVFFGTGNNTDFISDTTGGRRFWAVDAGLFPPTKNVFKDLDSEVDQIWAEAVMRWRIGEPLYLTPEMEHEAAAVREDHRVIDPRYGGVMEFVEREVPEDWLEWPTDRRCIYWGGGMKDGVKTVPRRTICAMEIWCELFGQPFAKLTKYEANEISNMLKALPGWERKNTAGRVGPEKRVVKYYARKDE